MTMVRHNTVHLPLIFVAFLIFIQSGCEDNASNPDPAESSKEILLGSYEKGDQSDGGVVMLDLEYSGSSVTGRAIIRSRLNEYPYLIVHLKGSRQGEAVQLGLDTERIPYQYELTIQATRDLAGDLAGTFFYSIDSLSADFECAVLDEDAAAVDTFVDMNVSVLGLAFDDDNIWISTVSADHILMNTDCSFEDTVTVLMWQGAHWTSDALTWNGTHLWGHLPVTISDGGETRNESEIEKFTREGVITDSFGIPFRTGGLAYDGADLWSLSTGSDSLFRFDTLGTILEGIEIGLPDLVDIEYEDGFFWGIGWFMKRLYKIDPSGEVVRVYHLPGETGIIFPSGIVYDGEHFWYSFNTTYLDARIYKITVVQ